MKLNVNTEESDTNWKSLIRIGGVSALIAGILFRRNIAAEIVLFSKYPPPITVAEWFALLQNNRLLGLSYLNIFDLINYALVGLMFLALYAVLKRVNKSYMVIAITFGFLGIAAYFSSNTAFSMFSLSDQYAAATTETQKNLLLASGQAMLVINRFSDLGSHPGTGGYISLLFVAIAGLITSVVMLRSTVFNRVTAYVGILASTFDLAYCIIFVFAPMVDSELLAIIFIPAAGLLLVTWHIMVGWKLFHLEK